MLWKYQPQRDTGIAQKKKPAVYNWLVSFLLIQSLIVNPNVFASAKNDYSSSSNGTKSIAILPLEFT